MSAGRWAGRSVIVTGGASGIGRALGARLSAAAAHVVLADVDGEGVSAAVSSMPGSVTAAVLDVRDAAAVDRLVAGVVRERGRLDLLINSAGISLGGRSHLMPREHWERTLEVNLGGVVNGVLAAYPQMVRQGTGQIVNVASMAGLAPTPFTAAYVASKHGVVGLSTALRIEAELHGVGVTALCPGSIETPILDRGPAEDLPPAPVGTLTPRAFLEMAHLRPMPVERFAAAALRGIERNRAVVIVPRSGYPLWWLQRASPWAMRQVAGALARRVLRGLPEG